MIPVTYTNKNRIRVNFDCTDVGPSGAKVTLFSTRDGVHWDIQGYDDTNSGYISFEAKEDGRYGFYVHAISRATCNKPPNPGDGPQWWAVIDTTPPDVKLYEPSLGRGAQAGNVVLSWSASDKNLADKPISLDFSESLDGPWTPIAHNIANSGKLVWQYPKNVPVRVYFRISAIDRANNQAICHTVTPFVIDPAEPKAVITGID
jgi:hypothetical protein